MAITFLNSLAVDTDVLYVDAINDRVGIGTSSPGAKLEIFGSGNTLRLDSAANQSKTILLRNVGSGTAEIKTDGNLDFNIEDGGRTMRFLNGNTERMRVTSGGELLLGKTSGSYRIDMETITGGNAFRTTRGTSDFRIFQANNGASYLGTGNNADLNIQTNQTTRMTIDSSGNVKINNGNLELGSEGISSGYVYSQESLYFNVDSNNTPESSVIVFGTGRTGNTGGSELMRIGPAGQIGIGGANYGTSGQVLTSNGSGSAPSWQNASGSSNWTLSGNDIYNSNSGNVGIGTSSPTTGKLVVHSGDIEVRDSTGNSGGRIKSYDDNHAIYFREGGNNQINYYEYGGNVSAGGGHRFFTGGLKANQTLKLQIGDDYTQINNSTRSPVFYDSNSTTYYVDPASTSVLRHVNFNNSGITAWYRSGGNARQRADARLDGTDAARLHWYGKNDSGTNTGFKHAWYDGADYVNVTAQSDFVYFDRVSGTVSVQSDGSFRAPIFYDSNNTGYYVDPASTSVTNAMQANSYLVNGTYDGNFGYTSMSWNGSTNYPTLFSSDADRWIMHIKPHIVWTQNGQRGYTGTTEGSVIRYEGNLAGSVYWDSGCLTDIASAGDYWGVTRSGTWAFYADPSRNLHAATSMRAPIFYDSNNTSYYVDPAGLSYINEIRSNEAQANPRWDTAFYVLQAQHWYGDTNSQTMYVGESGNDVLIRGQVAIGGTAIQAGYALTMTGHIDLNNSEINYVSQLHFNDNVRFYDDGNDNYLNFKWGDTGAGGIKFYDGNTTLHGYVYGDGGGRFGLLDNDGNWAVRIQTGTDPLELSCDSNTELRVYNSYVEALGSFRAPIFYDSNDTNYYVDPTTSSRLHSIVVGDGTPDTTPAGTTFSNTIKSTNGSNRVVNFEGSGTSISTWYTVGNTAYGAIDQSATYMSFWQNQGLGWSEQFRVHRGYQESLNSFRSPIFYDSNNTAYYVNAASTSVLNSINMNGAINMQNNNITNINHLSFNDPGASEGIEWLNGNGWKIYESPDNMSNASGNLQFTTGTTFRFRVDTSGNTFSSSSSRAPIFYDSNDTSYYLDPASSGVSLHINGIIDQDFQVTNLNSAWTAPGTSRDQGFIFGRFQNGASNAPATNDNANWFANIYSHPSGGTASYGVQLAGGNNDNQAFYLRRFSNGSAGSWRRIFHEGSSDVRAPIFYDSDNTSYYLDPAVAGVLNRVVAGTTSTSNSGSSLHVTGTTSATNPIGYFNHAWGGYGHAAYKFQGVAYGYAVEFQRTNPYDGIVQRFLYSTTQVGSISIGTSSTSYNTTSDYRLKENVIELTGGIERVKQLQPKRFNFIEDPDNTVDGFIAHETQEIVPESVTGDKDGVLPDGQPIYQGIDQAKLVPLLTAALQEAIAKIEDLETRIQILENQ